MHIPDSKAECIAVCCVERSMALKQAGRKGTKRHRWKREKDGGGRENERVR
jgi:hypothetical protein